MERDACHTRGDGRAQSPPYRRRSQDRRARLPLAVRYRDDAAKQRNPSVVEIFSKSASHCKLLAERTRRFS
jgi:hypothetical protein